MIEAVRKVFDLFGTKLRWKLVGLFGLILVMAFVQTVGVASILPFMNLVADPGTIESTPWVAWLYGTLGFESDRSFLIFAGVMVLGITAFSNAFSALTNWAMLRFIWDRQYRLSVELVSRYLEQPYSFHLNRNSAGLAKNILVEVKEAINGFVMPMMNAAAQAVVATFIVALLVWVDVLLAVVSVFVLGGAYGLLYAVVRRQQKYLGDQRLAANEARFQTSGEAFGGIKDVKVLGREEELLKRFARPARKFARVNAKNAIISQLPRYVLETVAFGGILMIVLYILGTQDDFGQAVAVMSLYALAGYRLMPALQQVFSGFAKARFFTAAMDHLHDELERDKAAVSTRSVAASRTTESLPFEREIFVDGVSFRYSDSDEVTIRDVSLRIEKDTTVGLAGSTGSGKTTLVDIILGLLEPREGGVRVDGVSLGPHNHSAWRRRVGYVPQHIYLLDDTITRNIGFGLSDDNIDMGAIERAARIAHLDDFILSLGKGYETVVGERGVRLSGGQRQRIGIARALYHDPDVLVMDEATSALDGITEDAVLQAIKDLASEKTIVLIAHRLVTLQDCDMIYLFDQGRIDASGTYRDLMESSQTFRTMARGGAEEVTVP